MEKIFVTGNVVADPALKTTANGKPVVEFRLAANKSTKRPDGSFQQTTHWYSVSLYVQSMSASFIPRGLRKGVFVAVSGHFDYKVTLDRNNAPVAYLKIIADYGSVVVQEHAAHPVGGTPTPTTAPSDDQPATPVTGEPKEEMPF